MGRCDYIINRSICSLSDDDSGRAALHRGEGRESRGDTGVAEEEGGVGRVGGRDHTDVCGMGEE